MQTKLIMCTCIYRTVVYQLMHFKKLEECIYDYMLRWLGFWPSAIFNGFYKSHKFYKKYHLLRLPYIMNNICNEKFYTCVALT